MAKTEKVFKAGLDVEVSTNHKVYKNQRKNLSFDISSSICSYNNHQGYQINEWLFNKFKLMGIEPQNDQDNQQT